MSGYHNESLKQYFLYSVQNVLSLLPKGVNRSPPLSRNCLKGDQDYRMNKFWKYFSLVLKCCCWNRI